MPDKSFIELQKESVDRMFFMEEYRSAILKNIERRYTTEIIREFFVSDFIPNGDKVIIKMEKRPFPLTSKELKEQYGR